MASENRFIAIGRITKDPEIRQAGQKQVVNFTIAISEKYKGEDKTVFVNCSAWGKQAENLANFCKKGSLIYFEGKHTTNEWVDKHDQKRRDVSYFMLGFQLLKDGKNSSRYQSNDGNRPY